MRSVWIASSLLLFACALSGCARAAEMIPGHGTRPPPKAVSGAPTAVTAPPLLAPGSLRLAGSAGAGGNRPAIPDAELAKAVVQIQALDSTNVARSGMGVVVDRQQQLVLTSYQLVQPYRADGTRAYSRLLLGPATGGGAPPEYAAVIVTANPQFDFAVLRVTGLREGGAQPAAFGEAVLADTSSLRRGDRLRFMTQPVADRSAPLAITNGTIGGFSGDGSGESRAYLKADMRLPGGAIGAPVFDQSGSLIGVGTQLAYDPNAPVGLVRPLARALDPIDQARKGGPNLTFYAALQHPASISGAGSASNARDAVAVSKPVFAENALEGPGFRDLFDYTNIFRADAADLDYEFFTQGIAPGTLIQELWYLNGVLQDALSSSYTWAQGNMAVVSDRLTTPNARGIPKGAWTLEVWVAGAVRATATAYVGIAPPDAPQKPALDGLRFASTSSPEQLPGAPPSAGAGQLLAFFNFRQAAGVQTVRWVALRDGHAITQSPPQTWYGGDHGTWWVGASNPDGSPIGVGSWEFQVYFDNMIAGSARVDVR